jgi:DNA replication protein DnaC
MAYQEQSIVRSRALSTIPERKLNNALKATVEACGLDRGKPLNGNLCPTCRAYNTAFLRYAESNIPVEYWYIDMENNFHGSKGLLDKYNKIVADIPLAYNNATSIIFAGSNGLGKTFTTSCILKRAVQAAYSGLYITLGDFVNVMMNAPNDEKYLSRKELLTVDFLVLDEWDSRYFSSESQANLYAKVLEEILRSRIQNRLPTFICTNSMSLTENITGKFKISIDSIANLVDFFIVLPGENIGDYRKVKKSERKKAEAAEKEAAKEVKE